MSTNVSGRAARSTVGDVVGDDHVDAVVAQQRDQSVGAVGRR